jgi:hypothetical protein
MLEQLQEARIISGGRRDNNTLLQDRTMAATQKLSFLTQEIADFLASCPSRAELLKYRPSPAVQKRARQLLQKSKQGRLTNYEESELDEFEFAEALMGLVKARIRSKKRSAS